jgi:hypothetical protein
MATPGQDRVLATSAGRAGDIFKSELISFRERYLRRLGAHVAFALFTWVVCIALLAAIWYSWFDWIVWACGGGAILIFMWLCRFRLNRPLKALCPSCGKYLPSNLPWICGCCTTRNESNSFLNVCVNCREAPTAYQCHHEECEEIIYLDRSYSAANCAYGISRPKPDMTGKRRRKEDVDEVEDGVKVLRASADGLELLEKIQTIKQRLEKKTSATPQSPRSVQDRVLEQWERQRGGVHEIDAAVEKLTQNAIKNFGHNPAKLEKELKSISLFRDDMVARLERQEL